MKQCEVCGKGSIIRGSRKKLRGNYNPTGTSRRFPNLQKTTTFDGRRVLSCAQCIKTAVKKKRIKKSK